MLQYSDMSDSFVGLAKSFKQNPELIAELHPIVGDTEDMQACWAEVQSLRPQLYALLAVVTEEVVDYSLNKNDLLSAVGQIGVGNEPLTEINDFERLRGALNFTLVLSSASIINGHRRADSPLIDRLDELCALYLFTGEGERFESTERLLRSGIGTAVKETTNGLSAISRIVRNNDPNATSESIAKIARINRLLINRVGAVNIEHLVAAGLLLQIAGTESDPILPGEPCVLDLKSDKDGNQYVDFSKPIAQTQHPSCMTPRTIGSKKVRMETLGCPASARLVGTSAMNKLWDWAVNIAERENLFMGSDVYNPAE